jgi:hypothetical protein
LQKLTTKKMKKLTLMLASALVLGLSSCSKDDDAGFSLNTTELQGKWNFNTERGLINGTEVSPASNYFGNATGCSRDYIQFNADMSAVEGDYENSGSTCELFLDNATYTTSGNTIAIVSNGTTTSYNVISQNATSMTVQEVEAFEGASFVTEYTFLKAE